VYMASFSKLKNANLPSIGIVPDKFQTKYSIYGIVLSSAYEVFLTSSDSRLDIP